MKSFLNHRSHYIIIPFLFIFLISCTKKEDAKVDSTTKTEFVLNEDSLSSPVYVAKHVVFKEELENYNEKENESSYLTFDLRNGIKATKMINHFPPAEMFYLWQIKNGKIDPIFSVYNYGFDDAENFYEKDFNNDGLLDLVVTGYSFTATSYTDIFLQLKTNNKKGKYERLKIYENVTPLFLDLNNDSILEIIDPNWKGMYYGLGLTDFKQYLSADWGELKIFQQNHLLLPELKNYFGNLTTPMLTYFPIKIYTINTNHNYLEEVTYRYPEILKMHLKCLLTTQLNYTAEDQKTQKEVKMHTKYMIHNINTRLEYATDTNFLPIFEKELEEKRRLERESFSPIDF